MFEFDVLELSENFQIVKKQSKIYYNTDNNSSLQSQIDYQVKSKTIFPKLSSALKVKKLGKVPNHFMGVLAVNSNNISGNAQGVYLLNGDITRGLTKMYFNEKNFLQLCSVFTVRRIIVGEWINWNDEYFQPNKNHDEFNQFEFDSLVYSLFESKSHQSSLRQVNCENQDWDIKNEFFWMSVDKMKELSDEKGYDELYNDARTSPDRYVHKLLFGEERIYDKLSPDAKAVLDKATELVEKSMELRQVMANDENHLNSWDAGYAQLKLVWKEYFQEDFKEFRQLYKNLEDRMRPLVYELGFLLK
jgi:hypothetical protein